MVECLETWHGVGELDVYFWMYSRASSENGAVILNAMTRAVFSEYMYTAATETLPIRGGGTKKKVGGLTLPLNDCTGAGVQGLHSEEFHDFTMPAVPSQCRRWCPSLKRKTYRLAPSLSRSVSLSVSLKTYPCSPPPHWPLKKWAPTPQIGGGGAKAPSAPPGSATPAPDLFRTVSIDCYVAEPSGESISYNIYYIL